MRFGIYVKNKAFAIMTELVRAAGQARRAARAAAVSWEV
jgi:hypothetical protein